MQRAGGPKDPLSIFYPVIHHWFLSMRMFGKYVSKDALCHRLVQALKEYEAVHGYRKKKPRFFQAQRAVELLDAKDKRGLFRQTAFDWRTNQVNKYCGPGFASLSVLSHLPNNKSTTDGVRH